MSFRRDLRRHQRQLLNARVQLTWTDREGVNRTASGHCHNVSESGLSVRIGLELTPRTYVSFRVEGGLLHGSASVRFCRATGWLCGVEFSGGLRWKFAAPV